MEKDEFIKIFNDVLSSHKKEAPSKVCEKWWCQWSHYIICFHLESPKESLKFFIETAVEKGCLESVPW